MKVITLASSSRGNSTVVVGERTKILIDAGLCLRDIENKLKKIDVNPSEINAILITHEHIDHTKGVGAFMRKHKNTYLVLHEKCAAAVIRRAGEVDLRRVAAFTEKPFNLGEFRARAFCIPHDCSACVGFVLEKEGKKISIATDFGHIATGLVENFYNSNLVILESNHDEKKLLANPKYSASLKQRILSNYGHISNNTAAKIICELAQNNVSQVVLAHLSPENNTPELAYNTICNQLIAAGITPGLHIKIDVANQFDVGTVFTIA